MPMVRRLEARGGDWRYHTRELTEGGEFRDLSGMREAYYRAIIFVGCFVWFWLPGEVVIRDTKVAFWLVCLFLSLRVGVGLGRLVL